MPSLDPDAAAYDTARQAAAAAAFHDLVATTTRGAESARHAARRYARDAGGLLPLRMAVSLHFHPHDGHDRMDPHRYSAPAAPAYYAADFSAAASTDQPGVLNPHQFVDGRAWDELLKDPYFDESGGKVASSRTTPAETPTLPPGVWKMDPAPGVHGRTIEQLCYLDPNRLVANEDLVPKNEDRRGDDSERYARWMEGGDVPPPIEVVQTPNGQWRIVDGHRRAYAAAEAGVSVPAWVSFAVPTGMTDPYTGEPVLTGLTYEIARDTGFTVPHQQVPYGQPPQTHYDRGEPTPYGDFGDEEELREYRPGETTPDGGKFEPEHEPDLGEFIANQFKNDYGEPDYGIGHETGFLLTDGRGVPMGPGQRYEDHRGAIPTEAAMVRWGWPEDVIRHYRESTRTPALVELMRRSGAVRVHADGDQLVLHHAAPLTGAQKRAVVDHVRDYRPGTVIVTPDGGREVELHNPTPWSVAAALDGRHEEPEDYGPANYARGSALAYSDPTTVRRMLAHVRENPEDLNAHAALADALADAYPSSPVHELVRREFNNFDPAVGPRHGLDEFHPVFNSFDGTFSHHASLGVSGPFRLWLGHNTGVDPSGANPPNPRWVVRAVSRHPESNDTAYTFEFPHDEAHVIPRMFPRAAEHISSDPAPRGVDLGAFRALEAELFDDEMHRRERRGESFDVGYARACTPVVYGLTPEQSERARRVDLIQLPDGVDGTRCENCEHYEVGYCRHPDVDMPVAPRFCCSLWDTPRTVHLGGVRNYDRGPATHYSVPAFLERIRRDPEDANARAVFADWLEEHAPHAVTRGTLNFLRTHQGPAWAAHAPNGRVYAGAHHDVDSFLNDVLGPDATVGGPYDWNEHRPLEAHFPRGVHAVAVVRHGPLGSIVFHQHPHFRDTVDVLDTLGDHPTDLWHRATLAAPFGTAPDGSDDVAGTVASRPDRFRAWMEHAADQYARRHLFPTDPDPEPSAADEQGPSAYGRGVLPLTSPPGVWYISETHRGGVMTQYFIDPTGGDELLGMGVPHGEAGWENGPFRPLGHGEVRVGHVPPDWDDVANTPNHWNVHHAELGDHLANLVGGEVGHPDPATGWDPENPPSYVRAAEHLLRDAPFEEPDPDYGRPPAPAHPDSIDHNAARLSRGDSPTHYSHPLRAVADAARGALQATVKLIGKPNLPPLHYPDMPEVAGPALYGPDDDPGFRVDRAAEHDHDEFLSKISENPDDTTRGLVYADWLEENGLPAHAEVVRTHGHLADAEAREAEHPDDAHGLEGAGMTYPLHPPEYAGARPTASGFYAEARHYPGGGGSEPATRIGLRMPWPAGRHPDPNHPYHHGREFVWSFDTHPAHADDLFARLLAEGAGVTDDSDHQPPEPGPAGYARGTPARYGIDRHPGYHPDERAFREAVDADPADANAHWAWADWLEDRGHHEDAAFRRSLGDWLRDRAGDQDHMEHLADVAPRGHEWGTAPGNFPAGVDPEFVPTRRAGWRPTPGVGEALHWNGNLYWPTYPSMEAGFRHAFGDYPREARGPRNPRVRHGNVPGLGHSLNPGAGGQAWWGLEGGDPGGAGDTHDWFAPAPEWDDLPVAVGDYPPYDGPDEIPEVPRDYGPAAYGPGGFSHMFAGSGDPVGAGGTDDTSRPVPAWEPDDEYNQQNR